MKVERASLVAMLRSLISAPATTAPDGSKTVPWTVPVVYWARAGPAHKQSARCGEREDSGAHDFCGHR